MRTTTAPTPRISILDGAGKSVKRVAALVVHCAGMVRTQRGAIVVVHLAGMVLCNVLCTFVITCEKRQGRGVRVSC